MKTTVYRWPRNDMGGYTRSDDKFRIQPVYRGCSTVQGWRLESLQDNSTNRTYESAADAKASVDNV